MIIIRDLLQHLCHLRKANEEINWDFKKNVLKAVWSEKQEQQINLGWSHEYSKPSQQVNIFLN